MSATGRATSTENYVPLREAGVLTLVEEDGEVTPGVRVRRTGGHTKHHQVLLIESGGKTAVFMADLIPTVAHVRLPWIMGYDLFPMETLEFKRAFLSEAVAREYLVFFEHDPVVTAGYLRERDGRITVERRDLRARPADLRAGSVASGRRYEGCASSRRRHRGAGSGLAATR